MLGFNFIHENRLESDKYLFFGPIGENEIFVVIDESWKMEDIFVTVGLTNSKNQTRNVV